MQVGIQMTESTTRTQTILSPFQQEMVLSVCPKGTYIAKAEYFQPEYVPGPIRVTVKTPGRHEDLLVIRMTRHGKVEKEALLLPVLTKLGLPVPEVLAAPKKDPDNPGNSAVAVYSFMPGITLQELSFRSTDDCNVASRLVLEGAVRLADVTPMLRKEPSVSLPTIKLADRLNAVVSKGGPWLEHEQFANATCKLGSVLEKTIDDLVFTGGDYQPANFLTDGKEVTGFVDFELAGYQDFMYGFVKYPIYNAYPFNKAGFVSFLLNETKVSVETFNIRLALGCLVTLQREISVTNGDHRYRNYVMEMLETAIASV